MMDSQSEEQIPIQNPETYLKMVHLIEYIRTITDEPSRRRILAKMMPSYRHRILSSRGVENLWETLIETYSENLTYGNFTGED